MGLSVEESVVKTWEAHGLTCLIREIVWKDGTSYYCGYVEVPEGHPAYKKSLWSMFDDVRVHGGLSFSGFLDATGESAFYLGFDCDHAGDCRIGDCPKMLYDGWLEHVWTLGEVEEETEKLAKQISEMR